MGAQASSGSKRWSYRTTQLPYLDTSWNITSAPLTLHPLATTTTAFGLGGWRVRFLHRYDPAVLSSPVLSRPVLSRPSINPVLSRCSFSPPAHPPAWWRHRIPDLHTSSGASRTVLSPRMTSACVWRWAPTTRWAAILFPWDDYITVCTGTSLPYQIRYYMCPLHSPHCSLFVARETLPPCPGRTSAFSLPAHMKQRIPTPTPNLDLLPCSSRR